MTKNYQPKIWKWLNKIAIIFSILGFLVTIIWIFPKVLNTESDVKLLQAQIREDTGPENILLKFFMLIEDWKLPEAYDLFSDIKKNISSYSTFKDWFSNLVWFEWLKITELTDKRTAKQKTYLVEYDFKKRGSNTIKTKIWFTLIFNWIDWKINYISNPLYENGWKKWACEFYKFLDYCN